MEFNTDLYTIKTDKLIVFSGILHAQKNKYHSRGDFFWAKQEENETPEDHWMKLITHETNCDFEDIKQGHWAKCPLCEKKCSLAQEKI